MGCFCDCDDREPVWLEWLESKNLGILSDVVRFQTQAGSKNRLQTQEI